MTIKKGTLIEYGLILLIIVNLGFLKILDIDFIATIGVKFTCIFSILFFILCKFLQSNESRVHNKYYKYINIYTFIVFVIIMFESIYTSNKYNSNFKELTNASIKFSCILVTYLIMYILEHKNNISKVLRIVKNFTLLALLLRFITWISYVKYQKLICPNLLYEYGEGWTRNGVNRITDTCLGGILGTIIFYEIISTKNRVKKLINIILLVMILLYDWFIYNSRAQILILIITIFFMYICKKRRSAKQLLTWIIIIGLIIYIYSLPITQNFIDSFSTSSILYGGSTQARINSIEYYLELFKKNIFFGIGLLDTSNPYFKSIVSGFYGTAYYEDLGLLGFVFNLGICGLTIFLLMYVRFIFITIKSFKSNNKYYILLLGITVYIGVASIMSANVFDTQRIFLVPVCFGVFEYLNCKMTQIQNENGDA